MFEKFKTRQLGKKYPDLYEVYHSYKHKKRCIEQVNWTHTMISELKTNLNLAQTKELKEHLTRETENMQRMALEAATALNQSFITYNEVLYQTRQKIKIKILEKYLNLLDKQKDL